MRVQKQRNGPEKEKLRSDAGFFAGHGSLPHSTSDEMEMRWVLLITVDRTGTGWPKVGWRGALHDVLHLLALIRRFAPPSPRL